MSKNVASADLGMIITGLGRSGTTFLAHILLNAGYDLGDVQPKNIANSFPIGGGLEYAPFARANTVIQGHLIKGVVQDGVLSLPEGDIEELKALAKKHYLLNQLWPKVLKDPRYLDTFLIWHAAGLIPKHVFLCMRPARERHRSLSMLYAQTTANERKYIDRTNCSFYSYFSVCQLLIFCLENDIPYTIVMYPKIGQDRVYAERILAPFIQDPWPIIKQTWDDNLFHHRL